MTLLIFSDIHGDKASLEKLMAIDADYYFAAGDFPGTQCYSTGGLRSIGRYRTGDEPMEIVSGPNHEPSYGGSS